MCGEKANRQRAAYPTQGSPPRVRGKVLSTAHFVLTFRITPACAGKSTEPPPNRRGRQDHPRVCGEKHLGQRPGLQLVGSPPRVRGKEKTSSCSLNVLGITPACAGKRDVTFFMICSIWDHPRVCGEKFENLMGQNDRTGSPPRVRGKERCHPSRSAEYGITPACAGKSPLPLCRHGSPWDHPRVCGEKPRHNALRLADVGSPPRVRGKGTTTRQPRAKPGITPACAGKSALQSSS